MYHLSAIKPVAHGPHIPIQNFLEILSCWSISKDTEDESMLELRDQQTCNASSSNQPKIYAQAQLNALSTDLHLSKESAQLLGSRLCEHNLPAPKTTFHWYLNQDEEFGKYFTWDEQHSLVFCNDVGGLVKALGIQYVATERRLF